MRYDTLVQILEGTMLICFGASWPIDIAHTLRAKHTSRKSLAFLTLILCGYAAGIVSKCVRGMGGGLRLEPVTWLYVVNAILVAIDAALLYYYQTRGADGSRSTQDRAEHSKD